ncbi:MAG TPA: bifunctional 5,10-methylenetetrahydrofolate dehydrogenase/5,10-methenyltetrahydrofolate cyclohydrolase [Candidatus Paceibacterota bacterium]|jgi:methylenetetrahydrofolate dehydrogenase (NADP+)/methenyltetrahydrofolate cyclohydrolase|nr:bifunctional 5,10-methylenetetrahydrofolate dehydrogenase/5,10-methenyltetrahydrofolate cyclohydrolase [Candidatus Paceibacterota bacterium]
MTLILDGKKARDYYKVGLASRVASLEKTSGTKPCLAILQVGDNRESGVYIEQKKKFGTAIGAVVDHIRFPVDITQADIEARVADLNADASVHGIIVQLPLPPQIDRLALMNAIDSNKDVDGLSERNQSLLSEGKPHMIPATAKGIMMLLDFYKVSVTGKTAAVFGRSRLVGGPIASLLRAKGASVSVIHSQTPDPVSISRGADIIIAALGQPRYITEDFVRKNVLVVDVGITGIDGKLVGDVDFDSVAPIASAISPVPGGVGPMTVLALFDNLILSAETSE